MQGAGTRLFVCHHRFDGLVRVGWFFVLVLCAVALSSSAQATVLTFNITPLADFDNVPQTYGDNVTSTTMGNFSYGAAQGFTPNVTVVYGNSDPALWTTQYGDLTNVLFEDTDDTGILNITLAGEPGFLVRLHSFDLAAYAPAFGSDPTINSVTIYNSANVALFTQNNGSISRTTRTPFTFAIPLSDTSLRIEVNALNLGGLNDDIAADNITFSQGVVPEPGTTALLAFLGTTALLRRRR